MFIYCGDEGQKAELEALLGDETLLRKPERSNGVDDLRFVLMVSKVSSTDFFAAAWYVHTVRGLLVSCERQKRGCASCMLN